MRPARGPAHTVQNSMKSFSFWLQTAVYHYLRETAGPHKFSCVQANLDDGIASVVLTMAQNVKDDDLTAGGREDQPHITVRYGLHSANVADVRPYLLNVRPMPIIGNLSVFTLPTFDVLKLDVVSPALIKLHDALGALPHTDTHPEYHPHITLAYVKSGEGAKYTAMKNPLAMMPIALNSVQFSAHDGQKTTIPLS